VTEIREDRRVVLLAGYISCPGRSRPRVMGEFTNKRLTDIVAITDAAIILVLNAVLLLQTFRVNIPGLLNTNRNQAQLSVDGYTLLSVTSPAGRMVRRPCSNFGIAPCVLSHTIFVSISKYPCAIRFRIK
jgi:hypothetical protein